LSTLGHHSIYIFIYQKQQSKTMLSRYIFHESVDSMTESSPYAIAKSVVVVDKVLFSEDNIISMINFVTEAGNVLFQGSVEDNKRFMHVGIGGWGPFHAAITAIEDQVKSLIQSYGDLSKKNLLMFTPTLIVSKAGCTQQQFHYDYSQEKGIVKSTKVKNSFFLIVSIMQNTSL
jgi:hypothetical protein